LGLETPSCRQFRFYGGTVPDYQQALETESTQPVKFAKETVTIVAKAGGY